MKLENFNLGANQLIRLCMLFSRSTASTTPANFTTVQMIYNHVNCQL